MSVCAQPSVQFTARAFCAKHVLFGAKRVVYPQPWLISFSSVTAKSKIKPIRELSNRFIKWVYSQGDSKALLGKYRRRTKLNISAILLENAVPYHHVIYHLPRFEYRIAYFSTGTLKKYFECLRATQRPIHSTCFLRETRGQPKRITCG